MAVHISPTMFMLASADAMIVSGDLKALWIAMSETTTKVNMDTEINVRLCEYDDSSFNSLFPRYKSRRISYLLFPQSNKIFDPYPFVFSYVSKEFSQIP